MKITLISGSNQGKYGYALIIPGYILRPINKGWTQLAAVKLSKERSAIKTICYITCREQNDQTQLAWHKL